MTVHSDLPQIECSHLLINKQQPWIRQRCAQGGEQARQLAARLCVRLIRPEEKGEVAPRRRHRFRSQAVEQCAHLAAM
jgi:hypothetical protein